jgi:hypothetical protein
VDGQERVGGVMGGRSINRHPELVSGSMPPIAHWIGVAEWMLNQVQHDGVLK